jgi:hypothetical protein
VSISVNRSDVTLIYRRGYTARSELPPLDVRSYVTRTRMTDAATAAIDLDDIRLRATSTFVTGRSATPEVRVELTIDPSRFSWPAPDGTPERTLDLTILCGDKQRHTIGSGTHRLTMGRAEEKFVFFVPVKGRPINAKVIVYSYDDDRVGFRSAHNGAPKLLWLDFDRPGLFQSDIDAAVAKERDRCLAILPYYEGTSALIDHVREAIRSGK